MTEPGADDTVLAVAYLAAAKEGTAEAFQRFNTQLQGQDSVVISWAGASRGDAVAATHLKILDGGTSQ